MILNHAILDSLREKYHVNNIEAQFDSYDSPGAVTMQTSLAGFERMAIDLLKPKREAIDIGEVFSITPIEIHSGKNVVCVRYPMDEYPLDTIIEPLNRLREALGSEGHKVIFIPQSIDVSILTVEQLKQMRDELNELIDSLNYNNIIGF